MARTSRSLKVRMVVIAVLVHLGIWFVATVASSVTAVNVLLDALDDELESQAKYIEYSSKLFISFIGSLDMPLDAEIGGMGISISEEMVWQGNPMMYWDLNGRLIYRTPNAPDFDPPLEPGFTNETIIQDSRETHWRVYYKLVEGYFWIAVGTDTRDSRREIARIGLRALYPIVLIIPMTIIGIYLSTSRGLKPMRRVAEAFASRSPTSLEPVDTEGVHDELKPLVMSVNGLLSRLADALENEHRFTANAAHELQTPLTAIKAEVQMHQRGVSDPQTRKILSSIESRVDRAVYTVRQLLILARLESHETSLSMGSVNLHQIAEQALADHAYLAMQRELVVSFPDEEQWMVRGEPEVLGTLVGNLLANAFRYTPEGGRVEISARLRGGVLCFHVANDCEPMTESERESMVDRFYRRPGTHSPGAGLGLSIVERIVQVHGARLTLSEWEDDSGLLVSVQFPA